MENFILVVHVLLAISIIGLIMLQQGKGAEMGASFGSGSSQTVFGAAGTGNLFSRMTGILAAIFFVTSVSLAVVAKKTSVIDSDYLPDATTAVETVVGDVEPTDLDAALEEASTMPEAEAFEALEGDIGEALEATKDRAEETLEDASKALEN